MKCLLTLLFNLNNFVAGNKVNEGQKSTVQHYSSCHCDYNLNNLSLTQCKAQMLHKKTYLTINTTLFIKIELVDDHKCDAKICH